MAKKKKQKKNRKTFRKKANPGRLVLPAETKKLIWGILLLLITIILTFSFTNKAGIAGRALMRGLLFLIGKTVFIVPLIFAVAGVIFLTTKYKRFLLPVILAILLLVLGISGILGGLNSAQKIVPAKPGPDQGQGQGGWLGYIFNLPLLKLFGFWVTQIISGVLIVIGSLIFWQFFKKTVPPKTDKDLLEKETPKPSFIKKIFRPKFKVKEIPPFAPKEPLLVSPQPALPELKTKTLEGSLISAPAGYEFPPLDLLESDKGEPSSGDIKANSAIIKKTLQNFDIPVEMSEVNVGPTVTQYTFKPAEGVKLSKITVLSNDISLALAAHPIRIEAPIPGKALVGIEVPNKVRMRVRLRNLFSLPDFQNYPSNLAIVLGKDVTGKAIFTDLGKMPHLLVAGATGTGKTCGADTLMFTEKGMLTFEELCPLPLNRETDFKIKLVTRDGIEETAKNYNNGICQFYKLTTKRGYQIEATTEHPLWVMNEDGSQSWKPASLIKKDDFVAISRGPALFGNKTDISDFKPSKIRANTKKISFPSKITPRLGQFLGLLTADGGLSIERKGFHRVVYTQANPYLIRLYKKSLKELFGITWFIEKKAGSNPKNKAKDIVVNSKQLKEFLAYLGMQSVKSPQKEIPRVIRTATKEIVTVYLRAVFDNDGYVGKGSIEFCISSKKLASQIHIMLLNFGIVSSLTIKKVKNYADNEYYKLSIYGEEARKFIQEIGFVRKEKYDKVKELLKLSPNPNVDLIPNISSLLRTLGQKYLNNFARLTNRGWKYRAGILVPKYAFNTLRAYNSGQRMPGYQGLEKILDFYQPISQESEYRELAKISKRNFYWDRVEKITRTCGVGYDFYVPGSDSFVGNGFVNHNTIYLNSLILSLLYRNGPDILKFILIDPKRVEFSVYEDFPHLLTPVIYDAQKTVNVLKWLTLEMERRFEVLAEAKVRDIGLYNEAALKKGESLMPYIILIVDELADLMAARGKEVEVGIVRLAQMARAVGIHLVVATQRPSVEVITGLIKANITSRIAFQVASQVDSRTIIDIAGAEKLLGLGDLLYVSAETAKPRRIQGAYVSEKEVKRVMEFFKKKGMPAVFKNELEENLRMELEKEELGEMGEISDSSFKGQDPLYEEARRLVIRSRKASASLLQRYLRIGYARAARLIDILEERGVVGPGEGAKPRQVYMKDEEEELEGWKKV